MLTRHLIDLSFCSEKATHQFFFHFSHFTRVLVAVEDILLVADVSRRARHLKPAVVFVRLSWRFATAAPVSPPLASYPKTLVFPYCVHMCCSSLTTGLKFGCLPSPYLEGHLYTSTQSSSKDESFLRCTSTIPAAVVSAMPIITLPRLICFLGLGHNHGRLCRVQLALEHHFLSSVSPIKQDRTEYEQYGVCTDNTWRDTNMFQKV